MEDLETSATLEFHGARYVVMVQVQQQMHVQVEAADAVAVPSSVWMGKFPASDVEQLTRQTGNSKRFPVFVQMLPHHTDAVGYRICGSPDGRTRISTDSAQITAWCHLGRVR
ncbi:hypothetical protein GN958_ATG14714 [Phytophthora infestans]|uniref:Uncharacterized protein n=1 Tax=Phytophthora infestans TaxID=4787 RepID=A0A8S9UCS2_PHYIN|nr:hypothetical protein GN958_ATG14714 [Phytophthora infestans]